MKKHSLAWLAPVPVAVSLLMASGAQAAERSFTPQAGTWVVTSEVNGKPGRGLAIDVQEDTFFMQVYNYQANGEATFHTALGVMQGNTVTAPLTHYAGGRYFGSEALTADEAGQAGNVTITFENGLKGTVQFPGEAPVVIERFVAGDSADAFKPQNAALMQGGQNAVWATIDGTNLHEVWQSNLVQAGAGYRLTLRPFSQVIAPPFTVIRELNYDCQRTTQGAAGFDCTQDASQAELDYLPKLSFRYAAADVTGTAVASEASGKDLKLVGHLLANGTVPSANATECQPALQTFVPGNSCNASRIPVNGTWVVADELNGKPGRGISMDVQNGVAVLQIFDYLSTGASTFHMGSGAYGQSAMDIGLFQYAGGRYFGGPARTGHEVQDAGAAYIDLQQADSLVEGTIQFPREAPKKIIRMDLTGHSSPAESLLGYWQLSMRKGNLSVNTRATLDRITDGVATNSSGSVRCQFVSVAERRATCGFYTVGAAPQEMASTSFFYNGHSPATGSVMKIKDSKGNLLGL